MNTTILVNRSHRLRRNQIPQLLVEPDILFTVPAGDARRLLLAPAVNAVEKLFSRGKEENIYLCGVSGYRSYERQEELYRAKREKDPREEQEVLWVAPPGASEHQTGLALDVSCQEMGYELEEGFGATKKVGGWRGVRLCLALSCGIRKGRKRLPGMDGNPGISDMLAGRWHCTLL